MRRKSLLSAAAIAAAASICSSLLLGVQASAAEPPAVEAACADVESIFARGSGQTVSEAGKEAAFFQSEMERRMPSTTTLHSYELGFQEIDGSQFPAVPVKGWLNGGYGTALDAKVTSGGAFLYGSSVNEGVRELSTYMSRRAAKCPGAVFVLGGYSQGAQVIGETYFEALDDDMRGRIVFNALFGDPKLYLPEGELRWPRLEIVAGKPVMHPAYTPACEGKGSDSNWRRGLIKCELDSGQLGARKPYVPAGWTEKTGLWCNNDDYVCGSSLNPFSNDGHGKYGGAGAPIAVAVQEIAKRLKVALPPEKSAGLDVSLNIIGVGTTGLDVVFLIDSTGSMSGSISEATRFASTMAGRIGALRGRVALVEYRDAGDEFTARILSGLSSDTKAFEQAISTIRADGGGDTPEALLHGLMTAFNGLDWRDGATKAAVVLTDAEFHDPDMVDGSTLEQVARRALEIDPVNVYPVVDSGVAASYAPLAEATSGQVIQNEGDAAAALESALTKLETRPVALLKHPQYYAPVGGSIVFDASASYANGGAAITSYDWDVNGDGTFETTSATPVLEHLYPVAFEGVMQVRVTDTNGAIANISAVVHIGTPPGSDLTEAPVVTAAAVSTEAGVSSVRVDWQSSDARAASWGISVDGFAIGTVGQGSRTIELTDVQRGADVELGVVGFNSAGDMGEVGVVVLPALGPPTAPSPTPSPGSPAPTASPDPTVPPTAGPTATPSPTTVASPAPSPSSAILPAGEVDSVQPAAAPELGNGFLASTGATVTWAAVGGLILMASGLAAVLVRRRGRSQR